MIDLVGCYTLCQAVLVVTHFRSRGLQNHREFFSEWHVYNGLCFPVTVQVFHTHKNHVSHNPATEALLHHRVFFFSFILMSQTRVFLSDFLVVVEL